MFDLVVIGAGLSGLMAAYTAAQAGLKTKVISRGLGSMHWGAGTIDVLGYDSDHVEEPVEKPLQQVQNLIKRNRAHPYARLSSGQLSSSLDDFLKLTEEVGLPYRGAADPGRNLSLPSPAGSVRPVFLAPRAQLGGELSRPEPMLIVGFEGMRDFYPHLIAENLSKQGYQARAAYLPLELITDRRDSNTIHLAQELEAGPRRGGLARELKRIARPGERIGLPAILGLNDHSQLLTELAVLFEVFEIPTLPPSVPGVRLFQKMLQKLREMGVTVDSGMEVVSYGATAAQNGEAAEVKWVASETSSRPLRHRGRYFLLATGGVLGGGFDSEISGRVWEVIFDLPLTAPQQRSDWFRASFLDPAGQPVFNGGVVVNDFFQPANGAGVPFYGNLWAAGNLLANCDAIQERSLEGTAISTGAAAAQAIIGQWMESRQ